MQCGHYHCTRCGLVAFPNFEGQGLVYVARDDRRRKRREFEPVPDACPLPAHLRPFRTKRV